MIELLNIDCMEYMRGVPDKYFQLAIVDPPYGIGEDGSKARTSPRRPNTYFNWEKHKRKAWDRVMGKTYYDELFRVSKNQIVFGANFFISKMPYDSSCWIVWDKNIGGDFADCELAWTSFKTSVRKWFGHSFIGTSAGKDRIHPTQKPVALYKWLLKNYAKDGDKIFDSHGGSMSIAIACHDMKFDLTLCEIDEDYYKAGVKRFEDHKKQLQLW